MQSGKVERRQPAAIGSRLSLARTSCAALGTLPCTDNPSSAFRRGDTGRCIPSSWDVCNLGIYFLCELCAVDHSSDSAVADHCAHHRWADHSRMLYEGRGVRSGCLSQGLRYNGLNGVCFAGKHTEVVHRPGMATARCEADVTNFSLLPLPYPPSPPCLT